MRNIKRYFSLREVLVITLAITISIAAGVGVFTYLKKEVVINDNGKLIAVNTMKTTVAEVLEQTGISVAQYDYISMPVDSRLGFKTTIQIKRAVPLKVTADGSDKTYMTYMDTVKDALQLAKVPYDDNDKLVGARFDDTVQTGMAIRLVRVDETYDTEQESIPFKVVNRQNAHMDKGATKVVQEGVEGTREKKFKIVKEDGMEIARTMISDIVASSPIDKLIEYGTILNFKTSRGETVRYAKSITMKATAYTNSLHDTGKEPGHPYYGITASGMRTRKGVIAVDPKVIPLGTRVYVEVPGRTDYGFSIAADTGSGIKGNRIDLFMDSESAAINWGVRNVKVYILIDN